MATKYPNFIDNFVNPKSEDEMSKVKHSSQHTDINDAVKAIETFLGTTDFKNKNAIATKASIAFDRTTLSVSSITSKDKISKGQLVSLINNNYVLADADNDLLVNVIGVSMTSINGDESCDISNNIAVTMDDWADVADSSKLTPNKKYYLANDGKITLNPSSKYLLCVGKSIDINTMVYNIDTNNILQVK